MTPPGSKQPDKPVGDGSESELNKSGSLFSWGKLIQDGQETWSSLKVGSNKDLNQSKSQQSTQPEQNNQNQQVNTNIISQLSFPSPPTTVGTSGLLSLPQSLSPTLTATHSPKLTPTLAPTSPSTSNKESSSHTKKPRAFSFLHSKNEPQSSLESGEASIVQPTIQPSPSTSPSAYSVLASVVEKDKEMKKEAKKETKKELKKELKKDLKKDDKPSFTDKLMERLVAAALPTASVNMADAEQRALHMKSNTPFSIPVMGRNFRNMTARTGVIYDAYYSAIRIVTWKSPAHTLSVLTIYSLLVLNLRLISAAPFIFLLAYSMAPAYFYRHPADPTLIVPYPDSTIPSDIQLLKIIAPAEYQPPSQNSSDSQQQKPKSSPNNASNNNNSSNSNSNSSNSNSSTNSLSSTSSATDVLIHYNHSPLIARGPPIAEAILPKPVPEISREFYMNVVDTQNAMDLYVQAYDTFSSLLNRFAYFSGDEATSSLAYVVLTACAVLAYSLTPIIISIVPWRFLFLVLGWGGVIQCHPRYDQEKVLKPIKKELEKTKRHGKKTLQKVVKNYQDRKKKGRSDSNVSALSLDGLGEDEDPKSEEAKFEALKSDDEMSMDSEMDFDSNENQTNKKETTISSTHIPEPQPYADLYTQVRYRFTYLNTFISSSLHLLNPFAPAFWDAVHDAALTEFGQNCEPLEQKVVEVFEFQFARTRVPKWAQREANGSGLVWDNWDMTANKNSKTGNSDKDSDSNEANNQQVDKSIQLLTTKYQMGIKSRVFTNWESSVYTNNSHIPRVRLSVVYTTNSQLNQLESVLATLAPNDDEDDSGDESEYDTEEGEGEGDESILEMLGLQSPPSKSSLTTKSDSKSDFKTTSKSSSKAESNKTKLARERKEAKEAQRAAETASSNDPFVLPGFGQLDQIQAPPFWQFVVGSGSGAKSGDGSNNSGNGSGPNANASSNVGSGFGPGVGWKMDMDVCTWVTNRGVELQSKSYDAEHEYLAEYDESRYLISKDGKFVVDVNEKWVYNTEPITYHSEQPPEEEVKREIKREVKSEEVDKKMENQSKTQAGQPNQSDQSTTSINPTNSNTSTSSSQSQSTESEKHLQTKKDKKEKRHKKEKKEHKSQGDVIWVRRRRWTRVCVRQHVA